MKAYKFLGTQFLTTALVWDDLVLAKDTELDINEILQWLKVKNKFSENDHLKKWLKPGYRVIFSGPSGTGKTMVAALLGKKTNRKVYKIDLSLVVSKYIGETEKNLSRIFELAKKKDWILFFDEADALFGKRTNVRDAHDRYANQEVSYLLQRIENYSGLVILASNSKNSIDDAVIRRCHRFISFPIPNKTERLKIWQNHFSGEFKLDQKFTNQLAEDYELTGGAINNVLHTAVLHSLSESETQISQKAVILAIRKELKKDSRG